MNTNDPIQSKIENSGGETEETIWCDVCLEDDQKIEATVYCQDCEKNQCENCDLIHKIRRFSKHVRTDPKPKKLIKFNQRTNNKINWNSKDIIELKKEIYKYTYNELLNSKSWKVQKYFTILRNQNSLFTTQKYLSYPSSSTILKFRTFTNCLNRYYYVINKNSNKFCPLCLKYKQKEEVIENIDHFLWVCPSYENNRLIFMNKLNEKNLYELILNHNSLLLFSLVNNREIYDFTLKFLKGNLSIRATRV
ncbi:brain tumor protein [Anaeramoeba flamelloides]|uniref:Brain tumor protein n=1 Tax=Anaeramoeba flamelloides TaxID=1746091 RepID=A0ABQ8Z0C4_9EUKA|nr:brain tumor protein [Anaeramoeba flamelloides]